MQYGDRSNDRALALKRAARKIQRLLEQAREKQANGEQHGLEIEARFLLKPEQALRFRLALALLQELRGMREEDLIADLLSRGVNSVMDEAASVVHGDLQQPEALPSRPTPPAGAASAWASMGVLN